jgi:PAS domain S-box-containing protein
MHKKFFPWKLFSALFLIGIGVVSISTLILYNTTIATETAKLQALSQSHAKLINSVAQYDSKFNKGFPAGSSRGATIFQITNAHFEKIGFGKTGEFVVGEISNGLIQFLIPSRNLAGDIPPVDPNTETAEPMRRALLGMSGGMHAPDYKGNQVLAWYEPIPDLDAGFVAKINISEIRSPFNNAALVGFVIAFVMSGLSCVAFVLILSWNSRRADASTKGDKPSANKVVILLTLIGCLSAVGATSVAGVVGLVYSTEIERQKSELLSLSEGMASLIGSIAEFDLMPKGGSVNINAAKATISQVKHSAKSNPGFGQSGEIVLGIVDGENISFLLPSRFTGAPSQSVSFKGTNAEPMRRALSGQSGVIEDLDYRGEIVIAAFQPVSRLNAGFVAKMDLQEIKHPYVLTGIIIVSLSIFIIVLGTLLAPHIVQGIEQTSGGGLTIEIASTGHLNKNDSIRKFAPVLFIVFAGFIFLLDYLTPLGVASGIPYIALLIIAAFFTGEKGILVLAFLSTVLVFAGWAITPNESAVFWKVLTNRLYAIFTIWLAAIILLRSKKAEKSVRQSETRLFALIESAPDATLIIGDEGEIIFANQQAETLFGYSKSKFNKLTVEALVPNDVEKQHPGLRANYLNSSNVRPMGEGLDLRAKKASGETFPVEISLSPIETSEGKVVAASVRDITERKVAETKLLDAFDVISSSINYAARIQRSVLPDDTLFSSLLTDHFVLWKPRDVVGGDIYWNRIWGDGFLIILGDCTGHGVPGAFMTLIATGALDNALSDVAGGQVAKLMQRLHQLVQVTLSQHRDGSESDDGMELGICYLDADMKKMIFVGARFELYIVEDNNVSVVKGTKSGIGYRGISHHQEYEEQEVVNLADKSFYMSSDGLVDQVGGKRDRMFGKKRFRELLLEMQAKPMKEQREYIHQSLIEYQGGQSRRDDVAVIGFKV